MHPVVKEIVKQLEPYKPEKIILFGSYASGKPHEESDVDLLVIKRTKEPFLERQVKVQLLLRSTTPVDAFVFTPKEFEQARSKSILIQEAMEKGKLIYG